MLATPQWTAHHFYRFPDTLLLSDIAKQNAIIEAIQACRSRGEPVVVLAHFEESFERLVDQLDTRRIDFDILTTDVTNDRLINLVETQSVGVSLASMLVAPARKLDSVRGPGIAVMVVERYPLGSYDRTIEQWCRAIAFPARLGYFVSIDDPLLAQFLDDRFRMLMEQFGPGEHGSLKSALISKTVQRAIRQIETKILHEKPARSALEWFDLNLPARK